MVVGPTKKVAVFLLRKSHLREAVGLWEGFISVTDWNWKSKGGASGGFTSGRKELIEMVGSELVEKVGSKLVENQLKIILLIREKPEITIKELSEILKISTTAIDKNIQKLKNMNLIKRIGPDKGGYWVVNNVEMNLK